MTENELEELTKKLTVSADNEPTIREIIREAESFLEAQLKAGLAADQRAMTFASISAAGTAIFLGGAITLTAAKFSLWPHLWAMIVIVVGMIAAIICAMTAARPTTFYYSGNNPKMWVDDIAAKRPLVELLAEQAALYAKGIGLNRNILSENHRWLWTAQRVALASLGIGALLEIIVLLTIASAPPA